MHRKRLEDPGDSLEHHRHLGDLARRRFRPIAPAPGCRTSGDAPSHGRCRRRLPRVFPGSASLRDSTRRTFLVSVARAWLSLAPRGFAAQLGGLFLFVPLLADCDLPGLVRQAGYPGSRMIPAPQAWLSLLGLKLSSTERKSHVMDLVFDEGLALFAGLNVVPKTTYLDTYSHRFSPKMNEKLRKLWIGVLQRKNLLKGESFNLDFHSTPFFGADEFVERHYLSKRSRSQKSILVFLAQDAESHVFCYSRADLLKREQADAVLDFVKFWKTAYGELPPELVFDSKLTTYAK